MTKHVSPEIAGTTELINTDYIRAIDGAIEIMVEGNPGWFVNYTSAQRHVANDDNAPRETTKKVRPKKGLTEFERLLEANTESPKNISLQFVQKNLERHFDPYDDKDDTYPEQDGAIFKNGKRRVRTRPGCNRAISESPWRDFTISKEAKVNPDIQTCFRSKVTYVDSRPPGRDFLFDGTWFCQPGCNDLAQTKAWVPAKGRRFRDIVKSDWFWLFWQLWRFVDRTPFLADIGGNTVPEGLRDTTQEALRNRAKIERYSAEAPKNDSEIFPRKPRNASPTREKDARRLNVWMEYRRPNGSLEPLQSSTERYDDAEREEGDAEQPERSPDAELETRPTRNELVALYSVPNVQYMSEIGYCRAHAPSVIIYSGNYGGDVECIGFHKDITLAECEDAARKSLGINATQKRIDKFIERTFKKEVRLKIAEVDMSREWSIYQIGGLRFAPKRTKDYRGQVVWRGALTSYKDKNGIWRRVKVDESGTSYGPKFLGSANQKDEEDMARKGWAVLHPLTRKTREWPLSGEEIAEQWANKDVKEEKKCRKLYHRRLGLDGPRRHPMPYDVKCDLPGSGYAFAARYQSPEVPADDVVERGSRLRAVNAMLSPQGLLVANAVVLTDRTNELAQNQKEVGTLLWSGCKEASDITLIRLGKQAIQDTEDELSVIFQKLAA
jgi:hypothetical protein